MKIEKWLSEWLSVCIKNNVKLKTYNRYKDIVQLHIIPAFRDMELCELDYGKIIKFISIKKSCGNLKNGQSLGQSSINGIIIVMTNALDEAVEFGYLESNPCNRIKRQKGEEKKIVALTITEQKKLENYIKINPKPYYLGILISLYTGIRIGELLALTWQDIDFEKRCLLINKTVSSTRDYDDKYITILQKPKTSSSERIIPLPHTLCMALKRIRQNNSENIVSKNKKPISIRGYQYLFERILNILEINKVGFHSLRHTFATRALECGFDVKTLSEIMGHSSVAITLNLYAHSQTTQKILMMEKLNKIFPKNFT